MRIAALLVSLVVFSLPVSAQDLRLGVVAPTSGSFARLGQQWVDGALAAARMHEGVELEVFDSGCDEEDAVDLGQRIVESGVTAVAGFLCTPVATAALPALTEAAIPLVTAIRSTGLTDQRSQTGWPVFRIGPRADEERAALAEILTARWREDFFAIVDDGTIYGRELAESFRASAEEAELEPVYVDTYRPQLDNQIGLVGRLRRAGATHVMVGGDRSDIAIIARDAAELGITLTIAGGEALRAESSGVQLREGVLMIAPPLWEETATPEALEALEAQKIVPDGYVLPGFASIEVLLAAHEQMQSGENSLIEALTKGSFRTVIGTVSFDDKGDREQQIYRLHRYDGQAFQEVE
ncbi:branched-chain amino acid ABC transporter substrate-binding protein [Nitratireductor basaltis]|uniref:Extracellular ligand-binding receptor n=1 Tax=Nitratireductor basaltis TaxID=472175 RepID=A0A084UBE4_9HYPH|nr:branched-chain amino acid ABC transporter substrate-binding protein [Nitratireductor basaltis]KFB10280.1 Extracellular ligand-binding receptor [Nitratireductor basaltis]